MDEASWQMVLAMAELNLRCFIVLTLEPLHSLAAITENNQTTAGDMSELVIPEAANYQWISPYIRRLLRHNAKHLHLKDFSFEEVQTILSKKLKVSATIPLPYGLDETVFQLSGGNPFWVWKISCITTFSLS